MAIFICLSNFFRMPEKCLIIFAFHIEKWRPGTSISPIFHLTKKKKKMCPNENRPSYIYILGGLPLFPVADENSM